MNVDQEVEIPVTTVETVITTTAEDVPIIETTLEEVYTSLFSVCGSSSAKDACSVS